uniref:Cilia- and flagella-associated protein 97 n=1 Tax=Scylla olivacea TaxID=85551 RepID=A0A0P4W8W9_SCYOL
MAHKVGQDDALHEPNTHSEVSLSPEADDQDVERTRGSEMVSGPLVSAVDGPSSSPGATCLEDSRYRCVEDTSSGGPQGEGQKGREEVWRQGRGGTEDSCETDMVGGSAGSFEAEQQQGLGAAAAVMEHADPNLYSSDEWEESDLSDTDGDHSDSSDDDDPKSQVDRLIEKVTLVYLDGENSNLSSESSDDSDDSDYDDSDSESDITDVSPLISATASPLGLSPVLPRRTLGTSPLALHDNRDLGFDYGAEVATEEHGYELTVPPVQPVERERHSYNSQEPSDMTVLLKAVVELEEEQRREQGSKRHSLQETPSQPIASQAPGDSHMPRRSPPIAIHPIDASPHHRHLRRAAGHHYRRKNMSFPNEEVRRIDRENQILLEKIMNTHSRTSTRHHHHHHHHHHHSHSNSSSSSNQSFPGHHHNSRPVHRPANSTINRRREEEKIRRENMILLRKIQEAKPSREVAAFRCGASARTGPGHVAATTARHKETAL